MKHATLLSLALHSSVILVIALLCVVAEYISNTSNKHIAIALTKESIPAHIVYLSQTNVSTNTPNSATNISPAASQMNMLEQMSTTADTPLTTHNSKLKIYNNPPKKIQPRHREKKKIEANKSSTQLNKKDHHVTKLSTSLATSAFSSAEEINNIMSELQSALTNYLAKQPPPYKSFNVMIRLTINNQGIIEKISFSPLPPQVLQDLLSQFLQSQNYTHKLLLPHSIDINIPLELIASSSN
ncbi:MULTISPECIES: hypothetical protein [Cysteiniphilum]|uniref:hypothetical protein n=1 Tax=Cysteiniphilum TaxID=2056696 RepID=UPI001782C2B2|nr:MULTISPECIES: hypothetical protein [Cysteiniphilum]